VRGRTPSLDDPYVWFDPINPSPRAERGPEAEMASGESEPRETGEWVGERPDGETAGDREVGRSRRRRRGRGRGERAQPNDLKVEARATNEGMPTDGSPDTPMAVMITADVDTAPVIAAEPQRRRVRRKPASASTTVETDLETAIAPDEAEPAVEAVELDITPAEAAAGFEATPAAESVPAVPAEPVTAPKPEADLSAIIASDPAQIAAPPEKPKRGWWRR
jgi:ribonuclease E